MNKLRFYSLSKCVWCRRTRAHLNDFGVKYELIEVDKLAEEEKKEAFTEMQKFNPRKSFPTLVFEGNAVVVGFKPDEIRAALNKHMV